MSNLGGCIPGALPFTASVKIVTLYTVYLQYSNMCLNIQYLPATQPAYGTAYLQYPGC
jgi:hypothetical protein